MRGPGEDVDKREVRVCEGEPDGGVIDLFQLARLAVDGEHGDFAGTKSLF